MFSAQSLLSKRYKIERCLWQNANTLKIASRGSKEYTDLMVRNTGAEVPPNAESLLRLPPLLDGGNAPLWEIAPAKTR
eukprot:5727838-Prymnesium_polylepis.1